MLPFYSDLKFRVFVVREPETVTVLFPFLRAVINLIHFSLWSSDCFTLFIIKMSNCKSCLVSIKKNQLKLSCDECQGEFHGKCVKMSQADVNCLEELNTVWRCDPCSVERRKSMRLDTSVQEGKLTLDDIMEVLNDIKKEQKTTKDDFNVSYEALHGELSDNTTALQNALKKIEEYSKVMDDLKAENNDLKNKVCELEERVENMEQYSRRNCLEVQGIPEGEGESVLDIVKDVGRALKMEITDSMIDTCHRLRQKKDAKGPRGIIVKFVRRMDKEALLKKRQEKKKDFSTRHLNLATPTDIPVFINESLSPARKRLLWQARQLKTDREYKYIWLRNGNILLRKEEGSPVITIKTQADLDKL